MERQVGFDSGNMKLIIINKMNKIYTPSSLSPGVPSGRSRLDEGAARHCFPFLLASLA